MPGLTEKPTVSIVIPVKNEEKNISHCLESIKQNDYPKEKLEIILVDNGSIDETVRIARRYGVHVIEKPGVTISGLRNAGVDKASGEIIAFIDADIIVAGDWISRGVSKLTHNAKVLCVGGHIDIPAQSTWIEKVWHKRIEANPQEIFVEWISSMNMFVYKAAFQSVRGFNETLVTGEDVDFCYRINNRGKILYTKTVRVIHTGEAKNLGHFFLKERWRGQSNVKGVLSHGIRLMELPSLMLPAFYLASPPLLLLFFYQTAYLGALILGMYIALPVVRSLLICGKLNQYRFCLQLTFLWWLYYNARGSAIVVKTDKRK